jgi:DNA recombination protein RmuC
MNLDLVSLVAGIAVGGAVSALALGRKVARLEAEKNALDGNVRLEFENLAARLLEEKSEKLKRESHEGLNQLLAPLRERLGDFQKRIEESFSQQAKEQFSLKNEIEKIVAANQKISLQAESLTKALKGDVKAQGNWGEVMLEKILEESGLRKGTDYITQGAGLGLRHTDSGGVQQPDVVVMLPEGKHVIIDAKVSLTSYERYCAATDEAERARHLKDYLASVRAHAQGLEGRRYQDTEKLGAPDFVLMFMPVEGAYSLAVQQDAALHAFAWDKKIVIVCPSTLFATLKTVASVWRIELQNRNALEIARQGGNLYDKVVSFVEDMQELGDRISGAAKTYEKALNKLSTGTGNIVKRAEDIRALGVKASKKMPLTLIHTDDDTSSQ